MSEAGQDLEFNVGVDVEDVGRFDVDGAPTDVLFTDGERAAHAGHGPARAAGTWCAKEATVKALWPWTRLDPRRVEVSREADGRPQVEVSGWDAPAAGVRLRVSISHTDSVATAVVVAWGPAPAGPTDPQAQGVGGA